MPDATKSNWTTKLGLIGPGLLVAATGVGAGDLATGAFTGSELGVTVLWVVIVGAFIKYVLNEGLTRWQLVTGQTLLEGALVQCPRPIRWLFYVYLAVWTYVVGAALMSACGVTAHAMFPLFHNPADGKIVYGIIHSIAGLLLVWIGGFRLFEKVMSVCIAIMFTVILVTAVALTRDWGAVAEGIVIPRIPDLHGEGLSWSLALMGGVGGTVTVLCYGYWIREEGRCSTDHLRLCRLDLAVGYGMTALFGIAMVMVGSKVEVRGGGALLIVDLADQLEASFGPVGRWAFLIGAWSAVSSSLLGVWQAVPYLFTDIQQIVSTRAPNEIKPISTQSRFYRACLLAIAIVPIAQLWQRFSYVQKIYAITGAAFLPMLAVTLLILNGNKRRMGSYANRPITAVLLAVTAVFFVVAYFVMSGI